MIQEVILSTERKASTTSSAAYQHRNCPSCDSGELSKLREVSADSPAEDRTYESIKSNWQSFFKDSSFFSYSRCADCDQLYCQTFFTSPQLHELYNRMTDNTANLPVEVLRKTQQGYFHILDSFEANSGNYLEFGPDIGLLSHECAIKGQFVKMTLIEPNVEVHAELSNSVGRVAHTVSADIESYRGLENGSLDVVTMIHVLDHLLDPSDVLNVLRSKMKKGAKIMIVTHDESSLLARVLKSRWPAFCLQHPQLYRRSTIQVALAKSGFRVLGQKKTANYFPLTYLLKHLAWALRLGNIPLPDWYKLTLPLRLGNIATVAVVE